MKKKMKILFMTIICLLSIAVTAQSYKGNVSIKTTEEKLNDLYCTGLFKTTHGTIIDIRSQINANTYLNVLDWLEGRVAGLQVYNTMSGIRLPIIRGNVAAIYLDEMFVPPGTLNMINVNDIAIIKIIKTPFFGGFNGGNGAISIYTLGGEDEEELE